MGIFISWGKTAECVVVALAFASFLTAIALKPMGILQACGYRGKMLFSWLRRKNNLAQSRLNLLAFACLLSCAVLSLCFSFLGKWSAIVGLAAYLVFFILYLYADAKVALKSPASFTPRFKRLAVVLWLVTALLVYVVVTLLNFADAVWGEALFSSLKYCVLAAFPAALFPLVALANLVALIYETPKNRSYVRKAKAKLAASGVKVVAVTGSYGKTTVKNLLTAMLSKKYKVVATPRSYNTPLGVAKTINSADLSSVDIFIAEMGARQLGDIIELCVLCPPDYSAITGICPQHLETFGSFDRIVAAKGEIIAGTKETCFIAEDCFGYYCECERVKKSDCVSDVVADCTGTRFTLSLGGEQRRVKTKLLGAHSAKNIGLSASIAYELGVTIDGIAEAIDGLDFVEHRLQLIESNGVHILDDGYNSNVVGAQAALDVLRSFGGKKIVVTPGLVELGVLEEQENKALGAKLVGLDRVILVGETLVAAVKSGYLEAGGEESRLVCVPTLAAAQDVLKGELSAGDAVLFLNDLPDLYL